MRDLFFFIRLFNPYKTWLFAGLFLTLITSLASISLLALSGWFITSAAIAGIMAPEGMAIAFNFIQPAAQIRALALIRTTGRYAERLVTHEATFRVLAEIRHWFFSKLIMQTPINGQNADLLHSLTQDIDALDALYLRLCSPFFIALLGGGVVTLFIATYSIQLALLIFFVLLISAILLPWIFNVLGRAGAEKIASLTVKFKIQQIEILQNIAEITVFKGYKRFKNKLLMISDQMLTVQESNNRLMALSTALTFVLTQLTVIALFIVVLAFQQEALSEPVLVMLVFCAMAVFELVMPLAAAMQMLSKTQASARRIRNIASHPCHIIETQQTQKTLHHGEINISHVSFRYSEKSDWVLKNISLKIPQGSKIAIVGRSGIGKTTLLHLILRFFDPIQGSIQYAGIHYKHILPKQLMAEFSVLSQQTELFSATIKQNLLMAKPSASDSEITQAIKMAGLNDLIQKSPEGLNTWIGEQHSKISGGEARRIALARVFLKNTPIIILDEPTEGLDQETASDILNTLEEIAEFKTLILVSHKTEALKLVDTIYKITAEGVKKI